MYSSFSADAQPGRLPHHTNRDANMDGPDSMIIWAYEPKRRLLGVCSYLVVRARNEKLARHLLSYQSVAAGRLEKLIIIKLFLLIDYH
jgi:hypothetical protein